MKKQFYSIAFNMPCWLLSLETVALVRLNISHHKSYYNWDKDEKKFILLHDFITSLACVKDRHKALSIITHYQHLYIPFVIKINECTFYKKNDGKKMILKGYCDSCVYKNVSTCYLD